MSNASSALTLAAGVGGGLAAWYLMRDQTFTPNRAQSNAAKSMPGDMPSRCAIRLDAHGLTADGTRVAIGEAIARCKAAGHADVTIVADAPATASAELMTALGRAGIATHAHRNAARAHRDAQAWANYTLKIYTHGRKAPPRLHWFRARAPIPWSEARARLASAGIIDLALAGRTSELGGWMLSVDPHDFRADRAEPMPEPRNAETASTFTLVVYPQGDRGPKRVRWFYADPATTWDDARDRLAVARLIDLRDTSPRVAGAWQLVTDPRVFDTHRAKPLPGERRDAARPATYSLDGRTITRDGEAIVRLERIDLGDGRYAITPHETDVLAKRIVGLLNRSRHYRQSPLDATPDECTPEDMR